MTMNSLSPKDALLVTMLVMEGLAGSVVGKGDGDQGQEDGLDK